MTYGYLQLGRDREARDVVDEIGSIRKLDVDNFVGIRLRRRSGALPTLERGRWSEAAARPCIPPTRLAALPQAEAIHWFARGVGAARSGNPAGRSRALARLEALREG